MQEVFAKLSMRIYTCFSIAPTMAYLRHHPIMSHRWMIVYQTALLTPTLYSFLSFACPIPPPALRRIALAAGPLVL